MDSFDIIPILGSVGINQKRHQGKEAPMTAKACMLIIRQRYPFVKLPGSKPVVRNGFSPVSFRYPEYPLFSFSH